MERIKDKCKIYSLFSSLLIENVVEDCFFSERSMFGYMVINQERCSEETPFHALGQCEWFVPYSHTFTEKSFVVKL